MFSAEFPFAPLLSGSTGVESILQTLWKEIDCLLLNDGTYSLFTANGDGESPQSLFVFIQNQESSGIF